MRTVLAIFGALLLAAAAAAGWGWLQFQHWREAPLALPPAEATLLVERGDRLPDVVMRLGLEWDWRWRLLARLEPATIQSGEYAIAPPVTPLAVVAKLASGDVVPHWFTIVEGWTWRQLRTALAADQVLIHDIDPGWTDAEVLAAAGLDLDHPEGRFLPETYRFVRGDTDLDLLRRAHAALDETLAQAWAGRDEDLPFADATELLVAASIIEKETGVAAERDQIAGVVVRRLQRGMRLEMDPTVIYGLGEDYDGNIRRVDLETDTPYNTYTRDGLPPTPIALPGRASIEAAAHPAPGDTLFFVADGSGGHTFSATYAEHQRAVRDLVRRQRAARRADDGGSP